MAKAVHARGLLLAACLGFGLVFPVAASPETDAFNTACNANPGFFSFAVEGLENDAEGLSRLCSCLVAEFANYPEADLALLTKDVEGTATPEDRTAYGDYTGLEIRARDAAERCVAAEWPAAPGTGTSSTPADMSGFDAACTNSTILLEVIGGAPEEATVQRATLCQCLTTALGSQITTGDAGILAQDLDGSATEESRAAYGSYDALSETAGGVFDQCFAALTPTE
jgi:hypothetical protein